MRNLFAYSEENETEATVEYLGKEFIVASPSQEQLRHRGYVYSRLNELALESTPPKWQRILSITCVLLEFFCIIVMESMITPSREGASLLTTPMPYVSIAISLLWIALRLSHARRLRLMRTSPEYVELSAESADMEKNLARSLGVPTDTAPTYYLSTPYISDDNPVDIGCFYVFLKNGYLCFCETETVPEVFGIPIGRITAVTETSEKEITFTVSPAEEDEEPWCVTFIDEKDGESVAEMLSLTVTK